MIVTTLFVGLLPLVSAGRIHKLKLQKIPPTSSNPALESAYLAEKYAPQVQQTPFMGAGGSGRRLGLPPTKDGEPLFWTQESVKGGHGVPLTSMYTRALLRAYVLADIPRDFMNAQYFTEIELGNPPQTVSS